MKMGVTDFINQFNETIKSCEAYLFITRDSDLQKEAIISLENLQKQVLVIKDQAIKNKDESFANITPITLKQTQADSGKYWVCLG